MWVALFLEILHGVTVPKSNESRVILELDVSVLLSTVRRCGPVEMQN